MGKKLGIFLDGINKINGIEGRGRVSHGGLKRGKAEVEGRKAWKQEEGSGI